MWLRTFIFVSSCGLRSCATRSCGVGNVLFRGTEETVETENKFISGGCSCRYCFQYIASNIKRWIEWLWLEGGYRNRIFINHPRIHQFVLCVRGSTRTSNRYKPDSTIIHEHWTFRFGLPIPLSHSFQKRNKHKRFR